MSDWRVGAYALMMVMNWVPRRGRHRHELVRMFSWKTCELLDHEPIAVFFGFSRSVYPAPCSASEPSSGKQSSLSAAMSMFSLASSNAERLWGRTLPSESSIVQAFQHASLKLLVVFINFFLYYYLAVLPLVWDACWPQLANQVRDVASWVWTTFSRPCGASSAIPEKGRLVAQDAAKCCCCLTCRVKTATSSCLFSVAVGHLVCAVSVYSEDQGVQTNLTLEVSRRR